MAESSTEDEQKPEEPEEFLNRAARRAKGKKRGPSDTPGQSDNRAHGRDVVQGRRQFGNRRTG